MQVHSQQKIKRLKELRKRGYSINELVKELSLPKTTVWHHVHKVKIPSKYINILKAKQGGSRVRTEVALAKATNEASEIMSSSNKHHSALLAMLYWAEGNAERGCTFTNTNPQMIKIYVRLLNKCFGIRKDRLSVTVRYFTGMSRNKCLSYWSQITKIPKNQIKMYYNDGGKRGRSPYGMCRITVRKGGYLLKVIRALIQEISNEINAPVAQLD